MTQTIELGRSRLKPDCLYWSSMSGGLMVLKGTTRLLCSKMTAKLKGGKTAEYDRFLILIPSAMARDSQLPFKPGQQLVITVDPKGKIVLNA